MIYCKTNGLHAQLLQRRWASRFYMSPQCFSGLLVACVRRHLGAALIIPYMRKQKSWDLRQRLAVSSGTGWHQAPQSLRAPPSAHASASPVTAALSIVTAFALAHCPASAPLGCGCNPLPSSSWVRHQACIPFQQLCPSQKLQKDSKGLGGPPGWGNPPYLPLFPGAKHPQVGRYSTSAHPKHTHRT